MFRRCTIPSNTSLTRKRGERGWTCRCGIGFGLAWQRLVRWHGNGPSPRLRVRLVFSRPYVAVFKLSAIGLARQGTCRNSNSQISYLSRVICYRAVVAGHGPPDARFAIRSATELSLG